MNGLEFAPEEAVISWKGAFGSQGRQRGEHLILNLKGVYDSCAIPELAVKHHDKMWQEERSSSPPLTYQATVVWQFS